MSQSIQHFLTINQSKIGHAVWPIPLGLDKHGNHAVEDLITLGHVLITGETGSGKSNFIHCIIQTLSDKYSPEEIEFVLIDPKAIEFDQYRNQEIYTSTVIDNALIGMDELERLTQTPTTNKYQLIVIDTFSDLALSDMARFINVIEDLTKQNSKRRLVISDSRLSREQFPQKLVSFFNTRICFKLAEPASAAILLDGVTAENLSQPGDYLLYQKHGKIFTNYHCPLAETD